MFSNYRPISLLPSISKIFEKVILEQLATYLDRNNLIHKHQYGFRKNHSTEYASLHIVDYLNYELDKNRTPTNIYLDLSKAFDSLYHDILLNKLQPHNKKYHRYSWYIYYNYIYHDGFRQRKNPFYYDY